MSGEEDPRVSARPANYTADRADRVVVDQFVHAAMPLLSESPPAEGWAQVVDVAKDTGGVLLGLDDGSTFFAPADRLMLIGWADG